MAAHYLVTVGPNTFEIPDIDDWRAVAEWIRNAADGHFKGERWFKTTEGHVYVNAPVLLGAYVHVQGEAPIIP